VLARCSTGVFMENRLLIALMIGIKIVGTQSETSKLCSRLDGELLFYALGYQLNNATRRLTAVISQEECHRSLCVALITKKDSLAPRCPNGSPVYNSSLQPRQRKMLSTPMS
jgi:hypothetical protein